MTSLRLIAALLLAISCAHPTLAQINPFRGTSATPLNADDLKALNEATTRLLDHPQLVSGASESWSNPQSGASGTVTAGQRLQRHGLACRVVKYQNTVPDSSKPRTPTLTWCKTKDGWKLG